ncbi:MAG: ferrochelatase [Pseudobdellovibrionaceae bacterium]
MKNKGILLVNVGTPDEPTAKSVGRYLREFLMDPFVIDIPFLLRFFLVNFLIVPFRSAKSATAYKIIWNHRGSPLRYFMQDLTERVQREFPDLHIAFAMRYGAPSLETEIKNMKEKGVEHLHLAPLYPQYAESSYQTSKERASKLAEKYGLKFSVQKEFYDNPDFIRTQADLIRPFLENSFDKILFSYHGLPQRHISKLEPECDSCFEAPCAMDAHLKRKKCYRAQCYATTEALAKQLGLKGSQYTTSFQSRLGRTPWIQPFTDHVIQKWGAEKLKRVVVVCPSFTIDCLETLEEIGNRAVEDFKTHGGGTLDLVPCLNEKTPNSVLGL